jgi:hypothetical protein
MGKKIVADSPVPLRLGWHAPKRSMKKCCSHLMD